MLLYLALAASVLSSGCGAILFSSASFLYCPVLEHCADSIYAFFLVYDYRFYCPNCIVLSRSTNGLQVVDCLQLILYEVVKSVVQ